MYNIACSWAIKRAKFLQ